MSLAINDVEDRALEHLYGFIRALGAAGISPGTDKQTDFLKAMAVAPPRSPTELYWTARVTLVGRLEEIEPFNRVFDAWFGGVVPPGARVAASGPRPQEAPPSDVVTEEDVAAVRWKDGAGQEASIEYVQGHCRFPVTSKQQRETLQEIQRALGKTLPLKNVRRLRPATSGSTLDLPRVLRRARHTGGDILNLHWREKPTRPRRTLLFVDVSGSLRQFSGESLRFAHAFVRANAATEVYTFGTTLTRVTKQLRERDVDAALESLSHVVLDVNGGTRIGSALQDFLADSRRSTVARGALVIIFSDGLERGDPTAMVSAVKRLARLAHRVVWWSPLASDPHYRPVTRGMESVVTHLDDLAGVRDLSSVLPALRRLPAVEAGPRACTAWIWQTQDPTAMT
jgi:hypothetical protein